MSCGQKAARCHGSRCPESPAVPSSSAVKSALMSRSSFIVCIMHIAGTDKPFMINVRTLKCRTFAPANETTDRPSNRKALQKLIPTL